MTDANQNSAKSAQEQLDEIESTLRKETFVGREVQKFKANSAYNKHKQAIIPYPSFANIISDLEELGQHPSAKVYAPYYLTYLMRLTNPKLATDPKTRLANMAQMQKLNKTIAEKLEAIRKEAMASGGTDDQQDQEFTRLLNATQLVPQGDDYALQTAADIQDRAVYIEDIGEEFIDDQPETAFEEQEDEAEIAAPAKAQAEAEAEARRLRHPDGLAAQVAEEQNVPLSEEQQAAHAQTRAAWPAEAAAATGPGQTTEEFLSFVGQISTLKEKDPEAYKKRLEEAEDETELAIIQNIVEVEKQVKGMISNFNTKTDRVETGTALRKPDESDVLGQLMHKSYQNGLFDLAAIAQEITKKSSDQDSAANSKNEKKPRAQPQLTV